MRFFNDWNTRRRLRSTGQALILIVLTFMGLLLFLGLMIDLGQVFLAKGYLRRAADAGSLAAAAQFREGRTHDEMTAAALEVARINGVDPTVITVKTCKDGSPTPAEKLLLCPDATAVPKEIPKKLVRVTIEIDYPLTFLSLLDIYTVHLVESSIGEAAAMDVVLVIDVSESMAWGTPPNYTIDHSVNNANPAVCNASNTCMPFFDVKDAATKFAKAILDRPNKDDEEDRLSIVTFANGWEAGARGTQIAMTWTNDYDVAWAAINDPAAGLKVYDPGDPGGICPYGKWGCDETHGLPPSPDDGVACPATIADIPTGPCLNYGDPDPVTGISPYYGLSCARTADLDTNDISGDPLKEHWKGDWAAISACGTTNIGGGLYFAGYQFGVQKRLDALWVVVLLTDGAANASFGVGEDINASPFDEFIFPPQDDEDFIDYLPYGFCPGPDDSTGTWIGPGREVDYSFASNRRFCQDDDVDVVHLESDPFPPLEYNADDFARDQAKYVACYANKPSDSCNGIKGQGAVIFTIGLGKKEITESLDNDASDPKPYGGALLRYIASLGDDGNADPATDPCKDETDYSVSCGNYFFAEAGSDLRRVFEMIYSRIFTRLTS